MKLPIYSLFKERILKTLKLVQNLWENVHNIDFVALALYFSTFPHQYLERIADLLQ